MRNREIKGLTVNQGRPDQYHIPLKGVARAWGNLIRGASSSSSTGARWAATSRSSGRNPNKQTTPQWKDFWDSAHKAEMLARRWPSEEDGEWNCHAVEWAIRALGDVMDPTETLGGLYARRYTVSPSLCRALEVYVALYLNVLDLDGDVRYTPDPVRPGDEAHLTITFVQSFELYKDWPGPGDPVNFV
jgi:hypothetical protein